MNEPRLITAESVTEGHPDKVCDQISDAILDDMLRQDPHSHVAVETSATTGQFFVFGEVTKRGLQRHPEHRALHGARHRVHQLLESVWTPTPAACWCR